jgi:hypothetical protein
VTRPRAMSLSLSFRSTGTGSSSRRRLIGLGKGALWMKRNETQFTRPACASLERSGFSASKSRHFALNVFEPNSVSFPQPPEEENEEWVVEFHPSNVMAFYKPWDSGDYDT